MKRLKYKFKSQLLTILLTSLIIISFFPNYTKSQTSDINFIFDNDVYYNNNSISFVQENNVRNITSFTNIFNASYSFENDTIASVPQFWNEFIGGGTVEVINSLDSHSKIVEVDDTSVIDVAHIYNDFTNEVSGTIEFWLYLDDNTEANRISFYEGSTLRFWLQTIAGDLKAFGGNDLIVSVNSQSWIHIRVDFESGLGAYEGLGADTFFVYVNSEKFGAFAFSSVSGFISRFQVGSGSGGGTPTTSFDGVGYSWLSNYTINDNFIPLQNVDDTLLEIDRYEFTLESVGNRMSSGTDNPSGWIDVESGGDNVNIGVFDGQFNNKGVEILSAIAPDNVNSIFKDDFSLSSERMNLTFGFIIPTLTGTLTKFKIEVKSLANNLVIQLEIRATGHLRWYIFPGTFETLRTDLTTDVYYEFNIYMDYSSDIGILIVSENDIPVNTFINQLYNVDNTGLRSIDVEGNYVDGNIFFELDYIGIYDNGSSIAKDLGFVVHRLYKGGEIENALDSTHNNLATINFTGNFELIYASFIGTPFPPYIIDSNFGTITDGFRIMSNNSRLFNFYDVNLIRRDPILIAYLNNGSKDFSFNSVLFEGVKLLEGNNTYWLEYSHNSILTNESFFSVSGSNLIYNLTTDDNNPEFIEGVFSIVNTSSTNRILSLDSNKNDLATGIFQVGFTSTSNFFNLLDGITLINSLLTQNRTINRFGILITDNDDNGVLGLTSGVINDVKLTFNVNSVFTLLTFSLITMMIPIIMILTPTLAISKKFGRDLVIPLFLLMSIICVATSIIPTWLFFIILIGSGLFIFTKRSKGEI